MSGLITALSFWKPGDRTGVNSIRAIKSLRRLPFSVIFSFSFFFQNGENPEPNRTWQEAMFCCFPHALSFKRSASCCALFLYLPACLLTRQLSLFSFTFCLSLLKQFYASQRRLILFIYSDVFADRHSHSHSVWRSGCITNPRCLYSPRTLCSTKVGAHNLLGPSDYLKLFEHRWLSTVCHNIPWYTPQDTRWNSILSL